MKKVIVIGSPGAGKSTFARKLHQKTELTLYHLDMIWHRPDKTHISREEFDARLEEILRTDSWIVDGNYGRTMERRMVSCDTIFLLDYPLEACLAGAEGRVGNKREDMPWMEEKLDEEFRQYILNFPNKELPEIYRLLERYGDGRQVIILRSRQEAEDFLTRKIDGRIG